MLTLNLISATLKKEIKLRHIHALIKKISYVFIIAIIIITITLLAAKFILQNTFNRVVSEMTLVTMNTQSYNAKVREINTKVNSVEKIQNEYIPWSYLIEDISKNTPKGISYSYIKMDNKLKAFKISGKADSRDDLLALKEWMEKNQTFKNINFPLKNILQKNDIIFEISSNLDLSKITKTDL